MIDVTISFDADAITKAIDEGAAQGLELGAEIVAKDAKGRAPQHTGVLVRSIQALPVEGNLSGGEISAVVSAGAHYATYVEFGTGIHGPKRQRIVPKKRKALRWAAPGGNGWIFAKSVAGMKAQPFLVPAAEENAEAVAEQVGDAIELAVLKAGK